MKRLLLFYFFLIPWHLFAFTVDLREPVFEDGVLKTDKGGIITGPHIRIQATQVIYTKKDNVEFIEAEGNVMVEIREYVFVGKRIEFDLISRSGILFDGRTGLEPWFFGGQEIILLPDGNYKIIDGFASTSENYDTEWEIISRESIIKEQQYLTARNVYFRFFKIPLFWLPKLHLNLDAIFDSPIKYSFFLGSSQGPRIGIAYEVYSSKCWKAFAHLDYRTRRGLGGGFEADYESEDGNHTLNTINYIAQDVTLYNHHPRTRYRYEGTYEGSYRDGKTTVDLAWDKISDKDMVTDYDDRGLTLATAKPTELHIREEYENFLSNFLTRVRVNEFQTVKQELPTLAGNFRSFQIGNTGVISENSFEVSYLDLEYTNGTDGKDYNSPRYELNYSFYRPYHYRNVNITPEAGGVSIYYGNNPDRHKRWMNIGFAGADINTNFYRFYGSVKHVVTPYIKYHYYCFPSTSPQDHYIFDINDGYYRLNIMRVGFDQSFYQKIFGNCIYRDLYIDLWTNVFFDTPSIESTAPIAYGRIVQNITQRLRYSISTGWDFRESMLDHYNYLLEWTISNDAAISAEYRHRSSYSWRKVDHNNFMLDSFHDVQYLRHSQLSDRRDTLLLNYYYQINPFWGFRLSSRHGWNRMHEPPFNEFEVDLLGTIRSTWHVKIYYRHREDEDRFSINFSIGLRAPSKKAYECAVPCLEF